MLPINSVAQAYTEQQQRQASIGETQASTMQRLMQVALGNFELQTAQKNQAMNDAYLEQLRNRTMYQAAVTTDPNSPSLAQQGSELKVINTDGSVSTVPGAMTAAVRADLQRQEFQTKQDLEFMKLWGRPHQEWTPLYTRLNSINNDLRIATEQQEKIQMENNQRIASMLRDADSPQAIDNAVKVIGQVYGKPAAFNIDRMLLHDPNTGSYLYNDAQRAKIAPIVNQFTSNQLRDESRHRQATEAQAVAQLEETKAYHNAEIAQRDAATALQRDQMRDTSARGWANLSLRKQIFEASGIKKEVDVTNKDQARIDKQADTVYRIADYRKGNEVASRVVAALDDPTKGYEAVSPANARVLVEQAKLMMDNYRSRTGGRYQEQQFARMNGVLQRVSAYVNSMGRGDPILAADSMKQLANEMRVMYADRNVDLLRDELAIAEKTNAKGGNAATLTLKGDVRDAVRSGKAKILNDNGREYIAFGKDKEDIFELPRAPERSRPIIALPGGE